jgi:hypothetical protein
MPRPLFGKIVSGLLQANLTTSAALDAIQHLIHTWALRQPAQLTREELLQRLAAPLSPPLKSGMNILRNITDQQVRHAYIMLSLALPGKAARNATTQSDRPPCRQTVTPFGAGLGWRSINDASWSDLRILCPERDQVAPVPRSAPACVTPSGNARVTAAVRLVTCSLV